MLALEVHASACTGKTPAACQQLELLVANPPAGCLVHVYELLSAIRTNGAGIPGAMGASMPGVCPDLRHAQAPTANPTYTSPPLVTKNGASTSGVSAGGLGMAKVMATPWMTSPHYEG